MSYAFAAPIPPGKTAAVRAFIAETLGPRKAELDDLQRRSGVTEESYWLQVDPEGTDILIVVSDSDSGGLLGDHGQPPDGLRPLVPGPDRENLGVRCE